MDQSLKMKMQRLAELLAESPLDDQIKDVIVENANQLTVSDVDSLIQSLERERAELILLDEDIRTMTRNEKVEEDKIEQIQQELVQARVNSFLAEVLKENLHKKSQ